MPEVTRNYGMPLILDQVQARLQSQLRKLDLGGYDRPSVALSGNVLTWTHPMPRRFDFANPQDISIAIQTRDLIAKGYCNEWLEFQFLRAIGMALQFVILDQDKQAVHQGQIESSECARAAP